MKNANDFTTGYLPLEPLKVTDYNIFSVHVAPSLDAKYRRLAIATVVTKSQYDIWDGNTIHHLELKDLYHYLSIGPVYTPYKNLLNKIIRVKQIRPPTSGDLNIVEWELFPDDTPLNYSLAEIVQLYKTVKL